MSKIFNGSGMIELAGTNWWKGSLAYLLSVITAIREFVIAKSIQWVMPFPRSSLKEYDSKESEMEACLETSRSEVLCQVWDNVFGPELLLALQKSADDFAVWRAKSPQRLLGFWLPANAEARTAPEVAGRKLQELLERKDLEIEWWCRTQVPSLGAHFHYDTHPF